MNNPWVTLVLLAMGGALTWSLAEYVLHGWVFHKTSRNFFSREHHQHHSIPGYFSPTWAKFINATVVLGAVGGGLSFAVGVRPAFAYALGIAGGYLVYEILHRRLHTHPPRGAYGRWARRHHFAHHFVDARFNHGVTSPVWDIVFGTHRPPAVIPVPRKFAPEWLWDESGDEVAAPYAPQYQLRRAAPRAA